MNKISTRRTLTQFSGFLTLLTLLSGMLLSSPSTSAEGSGAVTLSVDVPANCSLTVYPDHHSVTIEHNHTGTIGTSNIKSICNDPSGLAVYAVGYTNNTYGNTNLTATVGANTYNIASHATPSGTPAQSEWNMTLSPVSGDYVPNIVTGFDSAHAVPDIYTKIAYRNTMTDIGENATGAQFTATFNAYIDGSQATGTYTGLVKFLLVHPAMHEAPVTPVAVPHQICYYGNGEDDGSMACQTTIDIDGSTTALSANAEAQLRASNFSRAGYGFTGWNTKEDGSGTQYGPMETIAFTQDMYDNGLMLFANWKAAETGVTMQTFDASASPYSTMTNGSVIALKDTRDNDVYAVAKLADGKWWMMENLRLDHNANITTSNTQSNSGNWGGVFAGLAEPESTNFSSSSTTANSLYTTDDSSTDLRVITGSNQGYRFPRYNNNNTASRTANNTTSNTNVYSYGNYYTWAAAIADTAVYSTGNRSVTNTSLCPTGWHLPKGGDKSNEANNEWWNLTTTIIGANPANYDSTSQPNYTDSSNTEGSDASKLMRRYPTNLVYSGFYGVSSASFRGERGFYWSSTALVNAYYAYNESLYSSDVHPGTGVERKYYGLAVRCLADS